MFAQAGMWDAVISLGAWGAGIVIVILGSIWMFFGFLRWSINKWVGPAVGSVVKTHSDFLTNLSESLNGLNKSSAKQCDQLDVVTAKLEDNGKILEGSGIKCPFRVDVEYIKSRISPRMWESLKDHFIEQLKKKEGNITETS